MSRIPDDVLSELKHIDLVDLVRDAGVELRRCGRNWKGRCPFHDDEEPSLVVTPERGLWQCFGCKKGGSPIDWMMAQEGLPFREAAEKLQRERLPGAEFLVRPNAGTADEALIPPGLEDFEVEERIVAFYAEELLGSPKALSYLESRGLGDEGMLRRFRVGFSNRQLGLRLPVQQIQAGRQVREQLRGLGFLRESGHEAMRGRVVVPVLDVEGRLRQMYGRTITPSLRAGTPKHMLLARPLECFFHPEALSMGREVILCEAIFDALTFYASGFTNVVSVLGKQGLADSLVESLREHGIQRVLIAYDHDAGGNESAQRAAERLLEAGIEPFRVVFPKGMDANEYATAVTPAQRSLELVLRKAEWLGKGPGPSILVLGEEDAAKEKSRESEPVSEVQEGSTREATAPDPPPALETVLPVAPKLDIPCEVSAQEVVVHLGDRRYRVRGLSNNLAYAVLKVNLLASREDAFHVDTFDLYSARQRTVFQKATALELGLEEKIVKKDLGKVLLKLEELQDELIRGALESKEEKVELSAEETREALELLESPDFLTRILEDFDRCGVVGEETNKLVGYLAAISRKQTRPLAVMIQSSSAAGKSALLDAVLSFVPEEERVSYSAMTGQSLFYMGETDLKHKVLAIVEEEGAERASYALKLLQSEGELTIASTGKDPQTGKLKTHEYRVEGPVSILLTTTSIEVDEELQNRCLVLTVDEGREQTRAIHRLQRERETLEGQLLVEQRERILRLHRNAQRLLEPLLVLNPWAKSLEFPDGCTRARRDHEKYLGLIRAVTLLHQHQRQRQLRGDGADQVAYLEATVEDIEIANRLAHEVLGRSLDELPPQTRRLLLLLDEWCMEECERLGVDRNDFRFTRRQLREVLRWGNTQLKVHLARLVDLEYLSLAPGTHAQRHVYQLLYDGTGQDGKPFLPGLIEVDRLRTTMQNRSGFAANRSGQNGDWSGSGRPLVGPRSGGGRDEVSLVDSETSSEKQVIVPKNAYRGVEEKTSSYRTRTSYAEGR